MRALPRAKFAKGYYPPDPKPGVIAILRRIRRLYLRFGQGIREVRFYNPGPLVEAYREFYAGKARLLILFRHVEVADGPVLLSALAGEVWRMTKSRRARRRHGIVGPPLPRKPHAYFLYGKDVLNWAGAGARWAFPRVGGIPVVNTRLERASHEAIRRVIVRGEHPLALAPEGQVTYQMFHVSELAAGVGTMVRWIEEDSIAEPPRILVLPIAVGYHLARDHDALTRRVLAKVYRCLGEEEPRDADLVEGLLEATGLLVGRLEEAYRQAYPAVDGSRRGEGGPRDESSPGAASLDRRIEALCDRILRVSELGARGDGGTKLRRLFATRYRSVDLLYREDVDPRSLPPLSQAWADFRALDALAMDRHAQIVDVLMYIRPQYLAGTPGPHRRAEYALNLLDVTNRISGGNIDSRYSPKGKRGRLLVGSPIDAGAILRAPGGSPKGAMKTLNSHVQSALAALSADLESRLTEELPGPDRK
jgi:hypothetical protein